MYVREMRVRYRRRRIRREDPSGQVASPTDAGRLFVTLLGREVVEVCGLLCVSASRQIVAYHELSRGSLVETLVHPREVLKVALLANAAGLIIGHNHPSGDPTPSPADIDLTRRLRLASDLMGLQFLDHLIVGSEHYVSLRELGHF